MPRKKDEALHAARVQQILDAARTCFIACGFHQSSMRQILDAASISAGGAYNYFSSKDDIVKALVEAERADIDLALARLLDCEDPMSGIAQLVFDSIGYYNHDDAVLATEIYAESCRNPAISKVMQANTEMVSELLHDTLCRGMQNGSIRSDYSATELTEWMLALVDGYIGRIAANPKLKPKKAARMAKRSVVELLRHTK